MLSSIKNLNVSGECIENPHNHDGLPKETVTNDI